MSAFGSINAGPPVAATALPRCGAPAGGGHAVGDGAGHGALRPALRTGGVLDAGARAVDRPRSARCVLDLSVIRGGGRRAG
ncbi:MAG: hypothetical protein MUC68_15115 [Burkholderiaceae bacterium]|jgi:hypothetical protein|nr:hypothetical protein [Burkholderiaceae bacterium]